MEHFITSKIDIEKLMKLILDIINFMPPIKVYKGQLFLSQTLGLS